MWSVWSVKNSYCHPDLRWWGDLLSDMTKSLLTSTNWDILHYPLDLKIKVWFLRRTAESTRSKNDSHSCKTNFKTHFLEASFLIPKYTFLLEFSSRSLPVLQLFLLIFSLSSLLSRYSTTNFRANDTKAKTNNISQQNY